VLVPRLEGAPRDDVNPNSEEFLKILEQADVIKKRGTWLEVHQQIQVAIRASLSPGDGTEYGDPLSPALLRDAENLRAAAAQSLQCQHVIGHVSSVAPHDPLDANSNHDGGRWSFPQVGGQTVATVADDKHRGGCTGCCCRLPMSVRFSGGCASPAVSVAVRMIR
jgi:hypothetical protein